jgi:mono/diheme cytochrome c family protein
MIPRLLAVLVVAGCSREFAGGRVDGPAVYAAACATCHGPSGKPDLALVTKLGVRDLTAPEFRARVTVELVATQVKNGTNDGRMPAFAGALSDDQILEVARYVASLGRD